MQLSQQQKRLAIWGGIAALVVVVIILLVISSIQNAARGPFYVADSLPEANRDYTVPTNPHFSITFNRDIKDVSASQVSSEPSNFYRVATSGKTITIIPASGFHLEKYTLTIKNIESTDGYKIAEYVLPFNVVADDGAANSQVSVQKYPITAYIPYYSEDGWAIHLPQGGVVVDPPDGYAMPFFVIVDTPLEDSIMRDTADAQHKALEDMRNQAVQYLTGKGIKMEDYAFKYTDPYLQSKFGTTEPRKPPLDNN